jgi:hypothetical protein
MDSPFALLVSCSAEAVKCVHENLPDADEACKQLVQTALGRWNANVGKPDNITIGVVLFSTIGNASGTTGTSHSRAYP